MLVSKFKSGFLLPFVTPILMIGSLVLLAISCCRETSVFVLVFLSLFYSYGIFMFLLDLRMNVTHLIVNEEYISKRSFGGLGVKHNYYFSNIDGFVTVSFSNMFVTNEYVYIIADKKRILGVSTIYHKNYNEIKNAFINSNMKFLGTEVYNPVNEIKRNLGNIR